MHSKHVNTFRDHLLLLQDSQMQGPKRQLHQMHAESLSYIEFRNGTLLYNDYYPH
jgi:hypothetical protein